MAETSIPKLSESDLPQGGTQQDAEQNRHTEAALERHKREGLLMAVQARWIALAVIAVMLPFLNPNWFMVYYYLPLAGLALVGWLQLKVGRVGRSGPELALLFADLVLLCFALLFPNPFGPENWPDALNFRFNNFIYFFVILAAGTLSYSWRTIVAIGTWTSAIWLIGTGLVWYFGHQVEGLSEAILAAVGHDQQIADLIDPNNVAFDIRMQEVVVFLLVAGTLALSARRFNRLLLGNAALERERENLSRYFSPTMVEELSQNDEPLKQIKQQDVAVLFVDIVGFTQFAQERSADEIIATLRDFHGLMESEVFRFGGTLDKYLGDGLMATFGTPKPGQADASAALECTRSMMQVLADWNTQRQAAGQPEIKGSFGLHFGPVVLGDIGVNRLEFAVIGNTVNVASRLEGLSRSLKTQLVISESLRDRVAEECGADAEMLRNLTSRPPQPIRGLDRQMPVWTEDAIQSITVA